MNLVLDAGNTLLKLAVFEGKTLLYQEKTPLQDFCGAVKKVFKKYPGIKRALISSVVLLDQKDIAVLTVFCEVQVVNPDLKTPYRNSYATPHTLGADRRALATAAFFHNPKGNTLVIDAGSCITYELVTEGEYLGGAISPGLRMRYQALHEHTAKLPLLKPKNPLDFIGNSTENSIHSGVVNGLCNELDATIDQYHSRFPHLTVILTGGDAQFLSKRLKNTIFAHSNFLLEGLNHLLEYNNG